MEVINEKVITYAKARKVLEDAAKNKELGYEQNNALEYLKKFSKISMKKASDIIEALGKISKLKERHKVMIANSLPEDLDDVRVLFAHEIISLSEEDKKAIVSIVKKFA